MAAAKRRSLVLAGHDFGDIVGQGQAHRFFDRYDFEHSFLFPFSSYKKYILSEPDLSSSHRLSRQPAFASQKPWQALWSSYDCTTARSLDKRRSIRYPLTSLARCRALPAGSISCQTSPLKFL